MILMEVMGYAIEGRWVVKAEGRDVVEGYYVSGTALEQFYSSESGQLEDI